MGWLVKSCWERGRTTKGRGEGGVFWKLDCLTPSSTNGNTPPFLIPLNITSTQLTIKGCNGKRTYIIATQREREREGWTGTLCICSCCTFFLYLLSYVVFVVVFCICLFAHNSQGQL